MKVKKKERSDSTNIQSSIANFQSKDIQSDPNILIVDDKQQNLLVLENILQDSGLNLIKATSGKEALQHMLEYNFALILLDVQMPEMDGFETAELIRSNSDTQHIPIIFITAISKEQEHIFKGYESGAVDYLFKPVEPYILKSKVKIFVQLHRQKKIIEYNNMQLNKANTKILEQQEKFLEEERLKLMLQIAGTTAQDLNDPLMIILANIELLEESPNSPKVLAECISNIQKIGKRLTDVVKRIQFVSHDRTNTYPDTEKIINIEQTLNIIWVEDNDLCFATMSLMLEKKRKSHITRAITIKKAKELLSKNSYDLAFLDLNLPDGNSFELLNFIKSKDINMPIMMITGQGDEVVAIRCIQAGAHGYIPKTNISFDQFHHAVDNTFEKYHLNMQIKKAVAKMNEMSTRDALTGLFNRRHMEEVFNREFKRSSRYNTDLSCLILDLDYFKKINDTYGHDCGDRVLKNFSKMLEQCTRDSDYIFRYGGEEFIVLLTQTDIDGAAVAAEKIRKHCESREFIYNGHTLHVTVSIGISSLHSCLPEQANNLVSLADKALYRAKEDGRNCVRTYE